MESSELKVRTFAGATLIDTPLVHAALDYARAHNDQMTFHHVYRSWIFGTIIGSKIPAFFGFDREAHAVAAILHDLAWNYKSSFATPDKRFEVDGANAAREFLDREAPQWDKHRRQLVWDSIALHTTTSIARHKEPEVALCNMGISADFVGSKFPGEFLSREEYRAVISELPLCDLKNSVKKLFCGLCIHKAETTYDNFLRDFGTQFVDGYRPSNSVERLMKPIEDQ